MSLLKTSGPGESPVEMERMYKSFLDTVGMVPPSFLMYSASPDIQALQGQVIAYYRERSNLSPLLTALIRYLTALALGLDPCVAFNRKILLAQGMTEEQVEELGIDPAAAPLDEKEGWMLALVIKAVRAPEAFSEGHVRKLRDLGWTDTDIFDALHLACMMVGMDRMVRALKCNEE